MPSQPPLPPRQLVNLYLFIFAVAVPICSNTTPEFGFTYRVKTRGLGLSVWCKWW